MSIHNETLPNLAVLVIWGGRLDLVVSTYLGRSHSYSVTLQLRACPTDGGFTLMISECS